MEFVHCFVFAISVWNDIDVFRILSEVTRLGLGQLVWNTTINLKVRGLEFDYHHRLLGPELI